jgi:hypothetical protein
MKRYEEYTPEEVERLARECERLAERVDELTDACDELLEIGERLVLVIRTVLATSAPHPDQDWQEIHRHNVATIEKIAASLRDLHRIVATPPRESAETAPDSDLPF